MCLQTFQSHPFDGQLDSVLVVDAVIFFIIDVSGQAEVCDLYSVVLIQPARAEKEMTSRHIESFLYSPWFHFVCVIDTVQFRAFSALF